MRNLSLRAMVALSVGLFLGGLPQQQAAGQTELDLYGGLWIPFLPDYTAGSIVPNGGGSVLQPNIFRDDQIDAGAQVGLRGIHQFGAVPVQGEFDLNLAGVAEMGSRATVADPDAASTVWLANLTGNAFLATANGETATFSLDSDVLFYSEYVGLRDQVNLRGLGLGVVDLGIGFKHMAFEQDHLLSTTFNTTGLSGQYIEDIDTNYFGGEIRSTFHGSVGRRPVHLDFAVGLFDMDGDYNGTSVFRNAVGATTNTATVVDSIGETAVTVDVALRSDVYVRGVLVQPEISFMYLSDLVTMNHPQTIVLTNPVSLDTDSTYVIGLNVGILL
ncbi:MAG: hypothetical protein MI861_18980 [Pirellulales bacterium]|nr:hypothetical protein [Pirellulales bacterium]